MSRLYRKGSRVELLRSEHGTAVAASPEEIISSDEVDAVIIASSTDTHADLLINTVQSGKPAYCEKPIHLNIELVTEVADVVPTESGKWTDF